MQVRTIPRNNRTPTSIACDNLLDTLATDAVEHRMQERDGNSYFTTNSERTRSGRRSKLMLRDKKKIVFNKLSSFISTFCSRLIRMWSLSVTMSELRKSEIADMFKVEARGCNNKSPGATLLLNEAILLTGRW